MITNYKIADSPIHGKGLFALKNFVAGERITITTLPQTSEYANINPMEYFGRTDESGDYIKLGILKSSDLRFLNHQRENNAEYLDCVDNDRLLIDEYELIATKEIFEGSEITINYNTEEFQ